MALFKGRVTGPHQDTANTLNSLNLKEVRVMDILILDTYSFDFIFK